MSGIGFWIVFGGTPRYPPSPPRVVTRLLPLVLALGLLAPVAAQPVAHAGHGETCTLYLEDGVARPGPALDPAAHPRQRGAAVERVVTEGRTAVIVVDYDGFTAAARLAYQRAVDIWADHLTSTVPIRVFAQFGPLGDRVLGSAGPRLTRDVTGLPRTRTWYPFALADAIVGRDIFPPDEDGMNYDIESTFNSDFNDFHFGAGPPPSGDFDFTTIVLHELGHGLGFVGSGDVDNGNASDGRECSGTAGNGCWGYFGGTFSGFPLIFDRFIVDADARDFLSASVYPNDSQALGDLLQSQDLFVESETVTALYNGNAPIWAPATFKRGSSFSHWDEIIFTAGTPTALMTPELGPGETYRDPGSLTCGFFQDMGWELGEGCTLLVSTSAADPVPDDVFALVATSGAYGDAGPNPFTGATTVRLAVGVPQRVEVDLVDVLGRRVALLHAGDVAAGSLALRIDGARLAPGVYVVRARGASASAVVSLTHVE